MFLMLICRSDYILSGNTKACQRQRDAPHKERAARLLRAARFDPGRGTLRGNIPHHR